MFTKTSPNPSYKGGEPDKINFVDLPSPLRRGAGGEVLYQTSHIHLMIPIIIGTKDSMTHYFDEKGMAHAATIIKVAPVFVTQIKTTEKDGYTALQFGSLETKEKSVSKPVRGHLKNLPPLSHLTEVRMSDVGSYAVGTELNPFDIEPGAKVNATGITKAKGFQGVVKRYNFKGGRRSHGQKHSEREPGSIGGSGGRAGGRVAKGMRMAGRMGGDVQTVQNLEILAVLPDTNSILVKGALPGRRGTVIELTPKH